jgi:hypothetical protein
MLWLKYVVKYGRQVIAVYTDRPRNYLGIRATFELKPEESK